MAVSPDSVSALLVDFFSPEVEIDIELDGDSHFQVGAADYNQKRQQFIESFGIRIVRFLNTKIDDNLDGVLEAIGGEILKLHGEP